MTTKQRLQILVVAVVAIALVGSIVTACLYLFAPHRIPTWVSGATPAPSEAVPAVPETTSEPEPVASTEPKPEPGPATLSSPSAMSVPGKKSRSGSTDLKVNLDE